MLDPGGFQSRRPANDGEIHTAELTERRKGILAQTALADDDAHTELSHERSSEALHAIRGCGAHANRLVAGGESRARLDFSHVRRGVDYRMAAQVETRGAAAIEQVDLRRVANAVERALQRDRIVDPQRPHLRFGNRCGQFMMCHDEGPCSEAVSHTRRRKPGARASCRMALHVDRDRVHRDVRGGQFDMHGECR